MRLNNDMYTKANWRRRLVGAGVLSLAATLFSIFGAYQFVHSGLLLIAVISPGYMVNALFGIDGVASSMLLSEFVNFPYYLALIWGLRVLARRRDGDNGDKGPGSH